MVIPAVWAEEKADTAPVLTAEGEKAVLYNLEYGRILWSQGENDVIAPASFVKIMTAVLGFEHLAQQGDFIHTVSEYTVSKTTGTRINLKAGETIAFSQLLYALVVGSANDAALAIAEAVAGSEAEFVTQMNQKAKELGLSSATYFANPTGMDQSAMKSTLADLTKLCAYAYKINEYMVMSSVVDHTIPATNLSKKRELHTKNLLVDPNPYTGYYTSQAMGMSAGSTTQAGFCVATATEHNGLTYLILIAQGKYQKDVYSSFTDAKTLIRHAIDGYRLVPLVVKDNAITEMKVELGKDTDSVMLVYQEDVTGLLPTDYNPEQLELRYGYTHSLLTAPVSKGMQVGNVQVFYNQQYLGSTAIVTQRAVELSGMEAFSRELGNFFQLPAVRTVLLICILALGLVILVFGAIFILHRRKKTAKDRKAIKEYLAQDQKDLKEYRKQYWADRKIRKENRKEAIAEIQKVLAHRKRQKQKQAATVAKKPKAPARKTESPAPPPPPAPPPRRGDEYYRK